MALVATQGVALGSDVLLVPRHGSRTSSSAAFIDAVRPQVAVVQAGYRNRFGHPVAEVVDRYRQRGVQLADTVRCGAWTMASGAEGLPLKGHCERDACRRYWQHSMAQLEFESAGQ